MQDSFEEIAYTVGGAIVSPNLGTAELLVAALVACGFAFSAVHSLFVKGGTSETSRRERR
jgi:hypothetical protein